MKSPLNHDIGSGKAAAASSPYQPLLSRLPKEEQYAAVELFRGSMIRHSVVAYRDDRPDPAPVSFEGDAWLDYLPWRLPDTVMVQERLQPGAAAVLINKHHAFTDLYLPVNAQQKKLVEAIDGLRNVARVLFEGLWWYDQVVFDRTSSRRHT